MGASLTCDRCQRELDQGTPEDSPVVWEHEDGDQSSAQHLCDACHTTADTGYTKRTVYAVVGQENARRMREQSLEEKVTETLSSWEEVGMKQCTHCMASYRADLTACFFCGRSN